MPELLENIEAVRLFANRVSDRLRKGDFEKEVQNLQTLIAYFAATCLDVRFQVYQWMRDVFTGKVPQDDQVEVIVKNQIKQVLQEAIDVAQRGRSLRNKSIELTQLEYQLASMTYLLNNWVSPRIAVGPSPRVKMSEAARAEITANLLSLEPLPPAG